MFVTEVVHLDKQFVIVLVKQFEGLHSICRDRKCFFFELVHVLSFDCKNQDMSNHSHTPTLR